MGLTSKQKMMVAVLLAGTLLAVLNITLLSPALPSIMKDLGVDATTVQWLTSGYALVEACVIPMNAYLVGRFSTRKLFIGGITWFAIGSAIACFAPSFPFLLLGRVFQAMATGIVMPMVFTLILLLFPREKRGSAMGVIGLIIAFAPAIGPSLSGVLVDSVGWRMLFAIVTALAIIVVVFSVICLENLTEFDRAPLDVPSLLLMFPGMIALLYGLSSFTSSENILIPIALSLVGIVLLALFVRRQLKLETPMLQVRVLKTRKFRTVVVIIALLQAALVGSGVVMPIYIQQVLGGTATTSGLIMLPSALLGAATGFISGRIFDRRGVRGLAIVGALVIAAGGATLVTYQMDTSFFLVCAVYAVIGVGIQCLITPLNTWGVNSLDNSVIQHANSLSSTTNQVGGSFGTAIIVSLTGLAAIFAPDADVLTQTFTGVHYAFIGMCAMLVITALVIIVFVRDREEEKTVSIAAVTHGAPGVDRPWYVSDIMNPQAGFLTAGSTVRDAIAILRESETSGIPVVDESQAVVGFVSDGDILKYLSKQSGFYTDGVNYFEMFESQDFVERLEELLDLDVMRIATQRVVCVNAGDDPEDAFKTLADKRIKKVPVVKDGKLVGSLSRRNIISALSIVGQTQSA